MNSLVEEVLAENPYDGASSRFRKGYWREAVPAVKALVSTGFAVTEACRRVLTKLNLDHTNHLNHLRCAYYNYARDKNKTK